MLSSQALPRRAGSSVPFNPALLNPAIAAPFLDLQSAEQMHTSLSARVREVVILAVGDAWQADYELYAHVAVARTAGLL
jgi:4-carboxymuconolactone decarboxylase